MDENSQLNNKFKNREIHHNCYEVKSADTSRVSFISFIYDEISLTYLDLIQLKSAFTFKPVALSEPLVSAATLKHLLYDTTVR